MTFKNLDKKSVAFIKLINHIAPGLVIIIFLILKLLLVGNQFANGIFIENTLDFSWQSDVSERLLHGYLAGRDFIFTYGPLYQVLQSLPSLFFNLPSYVSVLLFPLTLSLVNYIILYYILRQVLRNAVILPFVIILTLVTFIFPIDENTLIRLLVPITFSLIYYRFSFLKNSLDTNKLLILFLPSFLGLYTFDLFITASIILFFFLLCETYLSLSKKTKKSYLFVAKKILLTLFLPIFLILVYEILVSLILSKNLNYVIYSFDAVKNYQYIMNIPFSTHQNYYPVLIPALLIFALFISFKEKLFTKEQKFIIIILFFTAILQLKSLLVRSDDSHIFQGTYPSLIILTLILYLWFKKLKKTYLLFLLVVFTFLFSNTSLFPLSSAKNIENYKLINKNISFFQIYKLLDNYYLTEDDFDYFSKLINNNPGNVMIYPYDTYILNINNQTFNTLPLQFYAYSNSRVEKDAVNKLAQAPPRFIILSIDTKTAVNLDDIPNFSRNPLIIKWIINNYYVYDDRGNHLVLRFNPDKKNKAAHIPDCSVYEIDTREIMKSNILENIFKTSAYYLEQKNKKNIRLPYTSNTPNVLIFENFDNLKEIRNIIEDNINFEKYYSSRKDLKIIKKYPVPGFQKEYNRFNVKCFESFLKVDALKLQ
ncbi:MAG: hypothetical protein HYT08_00910 [Candidatus Levybacteria bacterium]|nr:hypothetical protein [Candidatus Levybacteria bacterium]